MLKVGCLLLGLLCASPVWASTAVLSHLRVWDAPDHTRVVIQLTKPIDYHVFTLHKPERLVLDVQHAKVKSWSASAEKSRRIRRIRKGHPKPSVLRLVFDLPHRVQVRTFLLKPAHGKPHRLVIDLVSGKKAAEHQALALKTRPPTDVLIAIDAGHGGEDPGAIGRRGLKEKDVTLAVAKRVARLFRKHKHVHIILTRKADYYVPLRQRVRIARQAKADLMLSIHIDSVAHKPHIRGSSVYTLSERGASDKMAAMLAAKENASDAVAGLPPQVSDPMLNEILADMFKRDSLNSAQLFADKLLHRLKPVVGLKYKRPKHARFVVLGAAEIPSVLVELDFISNPQQERRLRGAHYQSALAQALVSACLDYLRQQGRLQAVSPMLYKQVSRQQGINDEG